METPHFAGLSIDENLDAAREKNAAQIRRKAIFRKAFDALPKGDLEALRNFAFPNFERFQAAELKEIYNAFRDMGDHNDMVKMFERCNNADFTNAPIVREYYIVACNATRRPNRAMRTAEALLREGHANGEVYGALGKGWFIRYQTVTKLAALLENAKTRPERIAFAKPYYQELFPNDPEFKHVRENAHKCLVRSRESYETGFTQTFEYYPGINAAYRMIQLNEIDDARHIARMTHIACLRDGARDTKSIRCAETLLEAACIMNPSPAEFQSALDMYLKVKPNRAQFEKTLKSVIWLRDAFAARGLDTQVCEAAVEKLANALEHYKRVDFNHAAKLKRAPTVNSAFHDASFTYRGLGSNYRGANSLPGNLKINGQLPDHAISREDGKQFNNLLATPLHKLTDDDYAVSHETLADIPSYAPRVFLHVVDATIRKSFGTDKRALEYLHNTEARRRYDQTIRAKIHLAGQSDGLVDDSRTNISVAFGIGLGDCRHHAQAKQHLFDTWQKMHMNNALRYAYTALKDGDMATYQSNIDAFHRIESVELRTIDVCVRAPIQIDENGRAIIDPTTGFPLATTDGSINTVEEHTMTFLVQHDEHDIMTRLDFADSFYQKHYAWGSGQVDLNMLKLDASGNIVIPGKDIFAVHAGDTVPFKVGIELTKTGYAGKRDKASTDEIGKLLLMGIPVDNSFDLVEKLLQPEEERMRPLEAMRQWYEKRTIPAVVPQALGYKPL